MERVYSSFAAQGLMQLYGARITQLDDGLCEIAVTGDDKLRQQHGFFHGGVVAALADTAGGYAAMTRAAADSDVLTVEFKLNLLSPAAGESLLARGEVVKAGKVLMVTRGEVFAVKDGQRKLCAIMQQTMIPSAPPQSLS
ncbi:MAG: PaaI family thioesterase [Magnetospirillum sp.]|nr:PaaI family thioesterase [Magnetospirillum sp.]